MRLLVVAVLAVLVAWTVDVLSTRRDLVPPAWARTPSGALPEGSALRRFLASSVLSLLFFFAVLQPLATIGLQQEIDLTGVTAPQLFITHAVFVLGLASWYVLGFWGHSSAPASTERERRRSPIDQFGLRTQDLKGEIALGMIAGVVGWALVIAVSAVAAALLGALGAQAALPSEPSKVVVFIAGLPILVRVLISLSAGVVEEIFFRGFLQPRVGILLSTGLFAIGHLSYDQPTLLIGITVLSLFFAALVQWRQSVWAAMVAHTVFDAIQLLILIPAVLELNAAGLAGLTMYVPAFF